MRGHRSQGGRPIINGGWGRTGFQWLKTFEDFPLGWLSRHPGQKWALAQHCCGPSCDREVTTYPQLWRQHAGTAGHSSHGLWET